jgi:hypothetical protein
MLYHKYALPKEIQLDLQDEVEMFTSPMDFVQVALCVERTFVYLRDGCPGIHFGDYWNDLVEPLLKEYLHSQDVARVNYACYAISGNLHPQQHHTLTPWMMDQCRYIHETWYPGDNEPPYGSLYDSEGGSVRAQWNH